MALAMEVSCVTAAPKRSTVARMRTQVDVWKGRRNSVTSSGDLPRFTNTENGNGTTLKRTKGSRPQGTFGFQAYFECEKKL